MMPNALQSTSDRLGIAWLIALHTAGPAGCILKGRDMVAFHRVPDSFISSTMSFVSNIADTHHIIFFWLDSKLSAVDCRIKNITREYQQFMGKVDCCDPLSPRVMADAGRQVGCLSAGQHPLPIADPDDYRTFLEEHSFVDELSLMLRCRGNYVAGISAFRNAHQMDTLELTRPFSNITSMLEKSIPYIEFNLTRYLGADKESIRSEMIDRYGLTPREAEIAELIGSGCTNADIATCLSLGVATVKTHVINLFRKTGVENRSSLVALLPR